MATGRDGEAFADAREASDITQRIKMRIYRPLGGRLKGWGVRIQVRIRHEALERGMGISNPDISAEWPRNKWLNAGGGGGRYYQDL